MKWKITRVADIPAPLRELGYRTEITIECNAVALPDVGKPAGEELERRAFFNGFEIVLKDGDKIEQVDA